MAAPIVNRRGGGAVRRARPRQRAFLMNATARGTDKEQHRAVSGANCTAPIMPQVSAVSGSRARHDCWHTRVVEPDLLGVARRAPPSFRNEMRMGTVIIDSWLSRAKYVQPSR